MKGKQRWEENKWSGQWKYGRKVIREETTVEEKRKENKKLT
jgi:hypothetical protein